MLSCLSVRCIQYLGGGLDGDWGAKDHGGPTATFDVPAPVTAAAVRAALEARLDLQPRNPGPPRPWAAFSTDGARIGELAGNQVDRYDLISIGSRRARRPPPEARRVANRAAVDDEGAAVASLRATAAPTHSPPVPINDDQIDDNR